MKIKNAHFLMSILLLNFSLVGAADIDRCYSKSDAEIDDFYKTSPERGAASQHAALIEWKKDIEGAKALPPERAIPLLASAVRKMTMKNIFQVPERIEIYDLALNQLLAIPGHSKLLVAEMESHASESDGGGGLRQWCLGGTLCHLPSPETVAVLGSYLNDERFPKPTGEAGSGAAGSNFRYAVASLFRLGIRGLESENFSTEDTYFVFPPDVERCRAWWAEVKSGRQAFSFRGKAVEYRFKPDGTWDSLPITNPPVDAIKPSAPAAGTQSTPAPRPVAPAVAQRSSAPWPWISAAVAVILTALGFVIWKSRRGKA